MGNGNDTIHTETGTLFTPFFHYAIRAAPEWISNPNKNKTKKIQMQNQRRILIILVPKLEKVRLSLSG